MVPTKSKRTRSPAPPDYPNEWGEINGAVRALPLPKAECRWMMNEYLNHKAYLRRVLAAGDEVRPPAKPSPAKSPRRKTRATALTTRHPSPAALQALEELAREFASRGLFKRLSSEQWGEFAQPEDLVEQVRGAVSMVSQLASLTAESVLTRQPKHFSITKRFFEDMKQIGHLIQRNKNMDGHRALLCVRKKCCSGTSPKEATLQLKDYLEAMDRHIHDYLDCYEARRRESIRNLDPLSHEFIEEMWECWRRFRHPLETEVPRHYLSKVDRRDFIRFLACGWRAGGLPIKDHRGGSREPLEEWFAERVRKWGRYVGR